MVRKKAKLRREKLKHKIASLNIKLGRSKHPEKINRDVKKQKCFVTSTSKTNLEFERSFYFF